MQNIYQAKGATLIEQYNDVGRLFSESIQKSVKKIGKSRSKLLKTRQLVAESAWDNLKDKEICKEFIGCFVAWCGGAMITPEQGMWLMADNLSGCQTFMARYGSGITLLHTEEDFENISMHMTGEKIIRFFEKGEMSACLVYNNLFPGAGLYGWKADLIVAVDSLFLKEDHLLEVKHPLLVNLVSWMIWRMKPEEADADKIIEMIDRLGTLIDGYAINVIRKIEARFEGYKLTLGRDESRIEYLGEDDGSFLRQVNIVEPMYEKMKSALSPKSIWRGGWKYFLNRLKVMDSHAKIYQRFSKYSLDHSELTTIHKVIHDTISIDLSEDYINNDLGAVCVGFVDKSSTSVSLRFFDQKEDKSSIILSISRGGEMVDAHA